MSCPDSQIFRKDKSFASGDMGDVLGKESDDAEGDEVSLEYKECGVPREDADGAPCSDEVDAFIYDSMGDNNIKLLSDIEKDQQNLEEDDEDENDVENEQLLQQNYSSNENQPCQRCTCESCKNYRVTYDSDSIEEMRMAQSRWMELRQYIRSVYRMAMEGNNSLVQPYQPHIKELVYRLCNRNPHLLFQRLEAQVQEFVIEAKVRQLELLHREKETPQLSRMFLTGLLDSYKKLMSAATQLAPLLEQLQKVHLSKFNVTWKVLNQHLYQSCVYTDPLVQNNVPHFISELSKCCDENAEANKKLVHDFLSFDDEITLVGGMWRDAETRIHQYNQEQATLKAKERMLQEDWKIFKEQRKLFQQKLWNKTLSEICDSDGDNDDISLPGHRGCPCDECSMTHIFCGGLVTPPHSPGLPSYTGNHKMITEVTRVDGEGQEVGATATPIGEIPSCECHVCTAPPMNLDNDCDTSAGVIVNTSPGGGPGTPHTLHSAGNTGPGCVSGANGSGGGFHLYPHIHGTGGGGGGGGSGSVGSSVYPHLYNIHTTLLQHHNSINSTAIQMNNFEQSMAATLQSTVNTTTTITNTVINDHNQVNTDCDISRNNCISSGPSKTSSITTRPGTPPPPSPRPLGVLKYSAGVSVNNNVTATVAASKSITQHNTSTVPSPISHHQQQRTHRHSTTQTTPQPQQSQSGAISQTSVSSTSPSPDHHSHNNIITGHSRLHQHQTVENNSINNTNSKVPQTGGVASHSCHKHAEPIKRVSTTDPQGGDDDDSASPEDSCSERSTSTQRDSRHCDCCYCEVFGHGVPSVAPVSRNYQEMRERLRQLLTKKKAKCKAAANSNTNNSSNSNISNSSSNNTTTTSSTAATHASSLSSLTSSMSSSSSSSSSSLSSTKLISNTAPLTNGIVAAAATSSSTTSSATVEIQKDPRDLEDLLDFIEGNPSAKCKDAKKAAKKARQKQKKQEELDRKKREEEEAERRRQELLIQQQKQQAALLKKQQQQQKQKQKKDKGGGKKNSNNNNNNNNCNNNNGNVSNNVNNSSSSSSSSNNNASNGPQMVTIKRVMEPNSAEPTVTITLRGATPSEDKVLYTLLNGQVCQVQKENNKNSKGKQQLAVNINSKGKNNNSNNKNNNNNVSTYNNNIVQQQNKKNSNNTNTKNANKSNMVHIQMNGHTNTTTPNANNNNNVHSNNSNSSNKKLPKSSLLSSASLTRNNSNNSNINSQMSHHTVAQVPPTASPQLTSPTAIQINNAINRLSSSKPNMSNFSLDNLKLPPGITITKVDPATVQQRRPPAQARQQAPSSRPSSAVPTTPTHHPATVVPPKPAASNVIVVDTGRLKDLTALQQSNEFNGNNVGGDDVSNGSNGKKKKKNKKGNNNGSTNGNVNNINRNDAASVISGSGGGSVTLLNGGQPQPQNGKLMMPQAAAIIKVNGSMVTIRSPALQQALANKTEVTGVNNNNTVSSNDQNKKRRKKKKGVSGQGQPDEWNLVDSVFAPKDIDLDNGDIDDAERELEAFKRFCLQSVPPKQKEKVHLNIKDIVLKKKASAISCS
ncbi:uncharacterized protein LOC142324799 isoform X2 [Lycorma delicatula]|uniref:uncharacterized protein LOC142324799 isoform X2 n=1 Tax=Lycorma delicatula TaxID=130591 RepID=UPI003F516A1C